MRNPLISFWQWTTHDPVAFYTSVLALFTGILGLSTIGLWIVTARGVRNQTRDTEILQRAYVSVEPAGIAPHYDKGDRVVGSVIFRNVGHLPARNVRWYASFKTLEMGAGGGDESHESFPTGEPHTGKIVLPPGTKSQRQIVIIPTTERLGSVVYIWGIVTYEDGLGHSRATRFCHRYGTKLVIGKPTFSFPAESAVLHEYGNDAD
jgi:hypothetical protein